MCACQLEGCDHCDQCDWLPSFSCFFSSGSAADDSSHQRDQSRLRTAPSPEEPPEPGIPIRIWSEPRSRSGKSVLFNLQPVEEVLMGLLKRCWSSDRWHLSFCLLNELFVDGSSNCCPPGSSRGSNSRLPSFSWHRKQFPDLI